jgi:hypothetical protein
MALGNDKERGLLGCIPSSEKRFFPELRTVPGADSEWCPPAVGPVAVHALGKLPGPFRQPRRHRWNALLQKEMT